MEARATELSDRARLKKHLIRGTIAGAIGCLVLGVAGWNAFVVAPDPQAICQHKMDLIARDTPAESLAAAKDLLAKLQDSCVTNAERRIRLEGKIAYADFAKCVAKANSLDQAERC